MSAHGSFVWYELMTADAAAAETFYRKVVGWGARDASQPGTAYRTFMVGEDTVAGLMTTPPEAAAAGARPAWFGYVAVDDVDTYAQRLTQAGGTVHRAPADIPGIGRFAMVSDPQGAVFVLFKGSIDRAPPPANPDVPGYGAWRELMAGDGAAAFDFYAGLFGWTKAATHDMGPMGVYQLFAKDGQDLGGMMTKPAEIPHPFWTYYFRVDATAAAAERIKAAGGTVINGPHEVPGGNWIVQGQDPQGAMFALVSPNA
ncbi:MAG TPA: VOC family protein [Caulobacteraceae bacterium]|jgi:hypothetical protein